MKPTPNDQETNTSLNRQKILINLSEFPNFSSYSNVSDVRNVLDI